MPNDPTARFYGAVAVVATYRIVSRVAMEVLK